MHDIKIAGPADGQHIELTEELPLANGLRLEPHGPKTQAGKEFLEAFSDRLLFETEEGEIGGLVAAAATDVSMSSSMRS